MIKIPLIDKMAECWTSKVSKHKIIYILLLTSLLFISLFVHTLVTYFMNYIYIFSIIILISSVFFSEVEFGKYAFIIGLFLLIFSIYILWIIFVIVFTYIFYKLMENRRKKKIKKYAEMTPEQISRISKKPKITVKIRRNNG